MCELSLKEILLYLLFLFIFVSLVGIFILYYFNIVVALEFIKDIDPSSYSNSIIPFSSTNKSSNKMNGVSFTLLYSD